MLNKKVFQLTDYRAFLEFLIKKNESHRGYKSRLAEAIVAQPSVINRILSGEMDLTLDQAIKLTKFFEMNELEQEYFLNLVTLGRAVTPELKRHIHIKLKHLKEEYEHLATRAKAKLPTHQFAAETYYSSWYYPVIHMLLTIPGFQTPDSIAGKLRISKGEALSFLESLNKIGLAENVGAKWRPLHVQMHIPREHPLNTVNHQQWRSRALEDLALQRTHSLHYSSGCTLSRADFEKIKSMLLTMIDKTREIITPSQEEAVAALCIDWFEI